VRLATIALLLLGVSCPIADAYEPRINYMLQCMGCHTPDGSGEPGRVPSIKETLGPFSLSADGRRFLVQVPGAAQSRLSDGELAELLNWMVQTLSRVRPEHFRLFTATEVATYRRNPLVEVRATRERLLRSSGVAGRTPGTGLALK
jgi:hypothetical protein